MSFFPTSSATSNNYCCPDVLGHQGTAWVSYLTLRTSKLIVLPFNWRGTRSLRSWWNVPDMKLMQHQTSNSACCILAILCYRENSSKCLYPSLLLCHWCKMCQQFNLVTVCRNKVSTLKSSVVRPCLSFETPTIVFILDNSLLPYIPEAFSFRVRLIAESG